MAGVAGFGLFVALDGVYVEGLLHVTELGNDYFHYDKARHEMAGERTGMRYRLGDRLRIKVSRIDLETTRIDFVLVGTMESSRAGEAETTLPPTAPAPKKARAKKPAVSKHGTGPKRAASRQPRTRTNKGSKKK